MLFVYDHRFVRSETGEVLSTAHLPEGTLLHVRVGQALAAELAPYRAGDRLTSEERVGAGR